MAAKGIMWLVVAAAMIWAGIWTGRQLHIVWNIWPGVDGVVVSGTVKESLQISSAKGGMPMRQYTPEVEFRYTVGGTTYTTVAPSIYTTDSYEQAAANLARLYVPGTHHPLRYNPSDPRDIRFGTVELAPLLFAFVLLIGGAVAFAVGCRCLIAALAPGPALAPAKECVVPGAVLHFTERTPEEPSTATLHCPACGRPVRADEDTCPNCLKSLRAA